MESKTERQLATSMDVNIKVAASRSAKLLLVIFLFNVIITVGYAVFFTQNNKANMLGKPMLVLVALSLLFLLAMKDKKEIIQDLTYVENKMNYKIFLFAIVANISVGFLITLIDQLMLLFGISLTASYEASFSVKYTFYNLLYICLVGPIFEEIIFRGTIMRWLMPYGKNFAIIMSSLLFGLYHGQLIQIISTCLSGLILAYIAMEYSIKWSMALHIFNNSILATGISALPKHLSGWVTHILEYSCILIFIIVVYLFKDKIKAIYMKGKSYYSVNKYFFSSILIWCYMILMLGIAVGNIISH